MLVELRKIILRRFQFLGYCMVRGFPRAEQQFTAAVSVGHVLSDHVKTGCYVKGGEEKSVKKWGKLYSNFLCLKYC